jgi:glyoxylase-like metal-dependent hydrolase (beta-lactamase superfamily II)
MRQEAEPARDEVTEVAPGVLRMQLPIEMIGLGHVNTYALLDDRGAALVDPGLPGTKSYDALMDRLADADIPLDRVHTLVITHSHHDHFGGVARLAEETGAAVIAHELFTTWGDDTSCTNPEHDHGDVDKLPKLEMRDRSPWGTHNEAPSAERLEELRRHIGADGEWAAPHVTRRMRHGDVLRLAGRDWHVRYTPGHTIDHLCFHDPEEGVLLSGDHVLPTITPHIGGAPERDPLEDFFASLEAIGSTPHVQTVLPAHGHPFDDLLGRTKSIHEHHLERLQRLRDYAAELDRPEGWASVVDFSRGLFQERNWGPMAESETWAHLEHLRLTGEAEQRWGADGLLEYRLAG